MSAALASIGTVLTIVGFGACLAYVWVQVLR